MFSKIKLDGEERLAVIFPEGETYASVATMIKSLADALGSVDTEMLDGSSSQEVARLLYLMLPSVEQAEDMLSCYFEGEKRQAKPMEAELLL